MESLHTNSDAVELKHSSESEVNRRDCGNDKIPNLNTNEGERMVDKNKQNKGRETKLENTRRKDSLTSDTASDKSSRSMILKFKLSFKSKKKKKKEDSLVKDSDGSYPSSPISCPSSSNGSSFINYGTSLSYDAPHGPGLSYSDINEGINETELVARLNLNGDMAYSCDCQMCRTHNLCKSHNQKHKLWHTKKGQKTKDKPKQLIKKTKVKKKEYIGDELSSTDDILFKDEGVVLKRRHKDYTRERLSSNSQDTVTPENTPPQTFTTNATSDVLSGLHYAIPYLPPRLRNRLQTPNQDTSQRNQNNAQSSKENKCSKAKSSLGRKEKHSKTHNSFYDNFDRDLCLDDFSDLDKDWDNINLDDVRNSSALPSSQITSRTNGEIYDGSIFARFRPVSFNSTYGVRPVMF